MSESQAKQMLALQELGLTLDDLREYLDTHMYDDFALQRFNATAKEYQRLQASYSEAYGPLSQSCFNGVNSLEGSQWAISDFPWDY